MKPNESNQVSDTFAALATDWTPSSAGSTVRMLYAPFSRDGQISHICAGVLSEVERAIADRFLNEDDKNNFLQRRAFRRYCGSVALGSQRTPLERIAFAETDKGHPYLRRNPELWFSFSSCRFGFLGAWSSTHAIGVDIEDQTRSLETAELAQHFFSKAEADIVRHADVREQALTFVQLWSLKESALKSVGEGLPFGLDAFAFDLHPTLRVSHAPSEHGGPGRFTAYLIEGTNTCAALVSRLRSTI